MKKIYLLPLIGVFLFTIDSKAQTIINQLIKSSPGDADKLIQAYAEPLFKSVGFGMGSGWTNTAAANDFLHFDLRITATATMIPGSAQNFDVTKIGLSSHVRPDNASNKISPTFGSNQSSYGPLMDVYDDNGNKVANFYLPPGQMSTIPTPQVELTVGVGANTDISIRGIPSVSASSDNSTVSLIGFGFKHDLAKDFVDVDAHYPPSDFDLAILAGYTHVTFNDPQYLTPDAGARPINSQQSSDFTHQNLRAQLNSLIAELVMSRTIGHFTPFLAVGYNSAHSKLNLLGNYPVTTAIDDFGQQYYTTFTNPVSINDQSLNTIRGDIGFQLKFGFFRIYASYSIAQYQSINGGIGVGL